MLPYLFVGVTEAKGTERARTVHSPNTLLRLGQQAIRPQCLCRIYVCVPSWSLEFVFGIFRNIPKAFNVIEMFPFTCLIYDVPPVYLFEWLIYVLAGIGPPPKVCSLLFRPNDRNQIKFWTASSNSDDNIIRTNFCFAVKLPHQRPCWVYLVKARLRYLARMEKFATSWTCRVKRIASVIVVELCAATDSAK